MQTTTPGVILLAKRILMKKTTKEDLFYWLKIFGIFMLAVLVWEFVFRSCEREEVSNGDLKEYLMQDSEERRQENQRLMHFVDSALIDIKQIDNEIIKDSIAAHSASLGENVTWIHNYLESR